MRLYVQIWIGLAGDSFLDAASILKAAPVQVPFDAVSRGEQFERICNSKTACHGVGLHLWDCTPSVWVPLP